LALVIKTHKYFIYLYFGVFIMGRSKWYSSSWQPNEIRYESTEVDLTASAGLGTIVDLFTQSSQYRAFRGSLPERKSNASYDTNHLAFILICGFWQGYDCLDDLEKFKSDPLMVAKFGEIPRAKTIGDYLRDFSDENIKDLNEVLTLQALESRRQMNASEDITLDIDSAANEQSGKKIEGVAWNYKNQWCLDSLVVYDELGFCYGMQLRAGNTFSSQGSEAMLRDILKTMPEAQRRRVTVRADSAFCSEDFIRMCLLMGVKFSITAHGNMGWEKEVNDLTFKPL
jgi:hypothetical protein